MTKRLMKEYKGYRYVCACSREHALIPIQEIDTLDGPIETPCCGVDMLAESKRVRDSLRLVRDRLRKALQAADRGDVDEAEAWLEAASTEESRHGDDPWTSDVAYMVLDILRLKAASERAR